MEIPLFRLPFLVQIVLHKFMELPEILSLATLSKRCRRLSKVLLSRQLSEVEISYGTEYKITLNGKEMEFDFKTFRAIRSSDTRKWKIMKAIFVPDRYRHLDPRDVVKTYGDRDQMTLRMVEFLFDLFKIQSISVKSDDIKSIVKFQNVIKACKEEHQNENTLLKLIFTGDPKERAVLPALHCDEVTLHCDITDKQFIQMAMTCKKVIDYNDFEAADLKKIFEAWKNDSSIEYIEMEYDEDYFDGAMRGVSEREIRIDGRIQDCYVIRQTSGKEAVVYHSNVNHHRGRVILRTDFEEVVDNN